MGGCAIPSLQHTPLYLRIDFTRRGRPSRLHARIGYREQTTVCLSGHTELNNYTASDDVMTLPCLVHIKHSNSQQPSRARFSSSSGSRSSASKRHQREGQHSKHTTLCDLGPRVATLLLPLLLKQPTPSGEAPPYLEDTIGTA